MISKFAIKDFLSRTLRDSNRAKQLDQEEADEKINALRIQPHFKTPPKYLHQKICFLLGVTRKRYLFLCGLGLGKSWITLAVLQYVHRLHQFKQANKPRALVLVPSTSNVGQWEDEITKQTNLSCVGVDAKGAGKRMLQVESDVDIVILTYAGYLALVCSGKIEFDENNNPKLDKEGDIKTKGWKIDKKKLKVFQKRFNFLIADEVNAVRGRKLLFRACKHLAWACERCYGLTGTPHGKDPIDLWAQFNVVDRGDSLGETIGLFREALFRKKLDFWRGFVWTFDHTKRFVLNRMLRHSAIRYTEDECSDLEPAVSIIRPVTFAEEHWAYYDRLLEELRKSHGNYNAVQNSFMRLRQLSFGYLSAKNSNGDKIDIRFKENPKLDCVMQLLEEIPQDRKVVVWNEYRASGDILEEAFRKHKIKYLRLYSGTPGKIKKNIAERFADPKIRVLLSSSAGAYGGNYQVANYSIWVERPTDPVLYMQETKRCHRIGQTRRVFLYDVIVKGSVDQKILESHQAGIDLFRAVVDGKTSGLSRGV